MTELSDEGRAQELLRESLQECSVFQPGSVVINDWTVRDRSRHKGPFAIIYNADSCGWEIASTCPSFRFELKVQLLVFFTDWQPSYDQLREVRGAMLRHLADNPDLADDISIIRVDNSGVMREFYHPLLAEDYIHNALPVYIEQQMRVEVQIL